MPLVDPNPPPVLPSNTYYHGGFPVTFGSLPAEPNDQDSDGDQGCMAYLDPEI